MTAVPPDPPLDPPAATEGWDFFAVADLEVAASVGSASDGDLWPSTWADDGHLYAACGDGLGFDLAAPWSDIVVNRIEGTPETGLTGTRLAAGRDVSPVWTDPERFNSKPTGIVAVDGDGDGRDELYLAVQDLRFGPDASAFNEAPAAGIVRSDDYGRTWHAPPRPMFTDHTFTTVMFLDFGRSNAASGRFGPARYVYAYGLDHNWRASYDGCVPDPEHLYLARVPAAAIQDRRAWEFFTGRTGSAWSADIADRVPVLSDRSRRHVGLTVAGPSGATVLSQGGVVYNAPLDRFLYSSWSEYTIELYEAPLPWGRWRHVMSRDFGPYPWVGPAGAVPRHGGYGTTIPSKFISDDGRDLWLQSNWFWRASTFEGRTYHYALRRLRLEPASWVVGARPRAQPPDGTNLATPGMGAHPVATACRSGRLEVLNDGRTDVGEDSWNGTAKLVDHWGYTWARPLRMNELVYVSGPYDANGGWFARPPRVEVRVDGRWIDPGARIGPEYPPDSRATGGREYVFEFATVQADGIRLVGAPGGFDSYSAISELAVFHRGRPSAMHAVASRGGRDL
ncbi:DUF4185 domain-containing protein [Phytoactinopolyspora limicola]|uniref:DUF4185 domain-containing protein n=1 Tax=Phytoactinopolyspora limicola TaxID=2715536 RepID=UPI001408DDCA|nr:DUF4185 domain-containing protein [Phytoactinopolyspora limicola]